MELIATPFADGINALCWRRELCGDFGEVVAKLAAGDGIVTVDDDEFLALEVRAAGREAIEVIREDLRQLREVERDPVLNCIHSYPRDEASGPVRTDVFSWHADSAPVEADTWLCTYYGPPSEGLPNEKALRRVDIPETTSSSLNILGSQRMTQNFAKRCESIASICITQRCRRRGHTRSALATSGGLQWIGLVAECRRVSIALRTQLSVSRRAYF